MARARNLLCFALATVSGAFATLLLDAGSLSADTRPEPAPHQDDEHDRLLREVAALRAELTACRHPQNGESVRSDAATPPETPAAVPQPLSISDAALLDTLLRELDEQRAAGATRGYYRHRLDELAELLLRTWVDGGYPQRALQLLQATHRQLDELDPRYALHVARSLRDQHDPLAVAAYQLALQFDIEDGQSIADLMQLDPQAGLTALDAHEQTHPGDAAVANSLLDERCRLLFASGQLPQALAAFDRLLQEGRADEALWQQMLSRAPSQATERLRALLAQADPDQDANATAALRTRLAKALRSTGDAAGARQQVQTVLATDANNVAAIELLAELDPAAARTLLESHVASDPSPENWQRLGASLVAAGKTAEAAAAFWDAHLAAPQDEGLQQRLLDIDPVPFAELMIATERSRSPGQLPTDFDELLGRAGKALWRAGHQERAKELWLEAQRRDPHDSEWPYYLTRIAAGRDPLAARTQRDWWTQPPNEGY